MNEMTKLIQYLNGGAGITAKSQHVSLQANLIRAIWQATNLKEAHFTITTPTHHATFNIIADQPADWHFPIGSLKYPPEKWYIATVHDLTGKLNRGYKHSGVDYNIEVLPRGDIDRGQPVHAVSSGRVYGTWHSQRNLASVVIQVNHQNAPLYVRYWHLARDTTFLNLRPNMPVTAGQTLGHLGDYKRGGDHLHFDMALDPFHPGCWLVPAVRWVDPVTVLKYHLDPKIVEASLRIG